VKRKLYTISHNIELLKEIDNSGGRFTSEEHSYAIKKEFSPEFVSMESVIRYWFRSGGARQLPVLAFLAGHILEKGYKNIVSFGAGTCVLEYFLKSALPSDVRIAATDFNDFYVEKAGKLLPGLIARKYDFFRDSVGPLMKDLGMEPELAVFLGSSYVMDDPEFTGQFNQLKRAGFKSVIDFHGGFMTFNAMLEYIKRDLVSPLARNRALRKAFNKEPLGSAYAGKFHGFSRSRSALRKLYRESGFKIRSEMKIEPSYKYTAVLVDE
jgi:hypothetical protein